MLEKVKLALRITTNAYDTELNGYIAAAQLDLGIAGVEIPEQLDAIVETAIITYVKCKFGELDPQVSDRLKASYDEQKAQLSMATGYTVWTDQT
jgi:hypothetical protein